MGVTVIQERNALSDFLRGLSPIVDAWGQRYKERGKANILNEVEQYQNAKPQFMDVGAIAGDAYRPASAEMFIDRGQQATPEMFTDGGNVGGYSAVSPQFNTQTPTEDFIKAMNPNIMGGLAKAFSQGGEGYSAVNPQVNTQTSPGDLMRMVNPGVLGELAKAYRVNSTAQADFEKNREITKADLQKRGADYFGGSEMKALLDGAEQKQRVKDLSGMINSGATYQDIMRAASGIASANGDLAGVVSAAGGIKPNYQLSSVNTGSETHLVQHDSANPSGMKTTTLKNDLTPGQEQIGVEKKLDRKFTKEMKDIDQKFEWSKMDKTQEQTLQRLKYQADLGDASALKQYKAAQSQAQLQVKSHQEWVKNNFGKPESDSPFYTGAQNAANFLNGGSGGAGTGNSKPTPQIPTSFPERRVPTDQFQSMIAQVKADAQSKGYSISDAEAIDILGKNYNIFWKSSTER